MTPVQQIAAVASDQDVTAAAAEDLIVSATTADDVVPRAAGEHVVPAGARDRALRNGWPRSEEHRDVAEAGVGHRQVGVVVAVELADRIPRSARFGRQYRSPTG